MMYILSPSSLTWDNFTGSCLQCDFRSDAYVFEDYQRTGIDMPAPIARSVPERQAEFLAGRYLAQEIMKGMGVEEPLGIGKDRAPCWPVGVVGSISHDESKAVCAVLQSEDSSQGIGIDIAAFPSYDLFECLVDTVFDQGELALLHHVESVDIQPVTCVFSAKESIFKALYPQVKEYFDFRDVRLIAFGERTLKFQLKRQLALNLREGAKITVQYFFTDDNVLTFTQSTWLE